ncbi:hypothetical protein BV20DRAFT_984039, partial [Pilatotrama ljubarskyi]
MALEPERSLFFAGSDDEEMADSETKPEASAAPMTEGPSRAATQPRSPTQKPLFFADSDDEEPSRYNAAKLPTPLHVPEEPELDLDVEMPEFVDVPRASSVSRSFLVDRAWSTVKGTGYIKAGEEVLIERDEPDKPPPPPVKKSTKDKGGKKQLTIASMLKPAAPPKPSKKKQDSVVRLTNSRGF